MLLHLYLLGNGILLCRVWNIVFSFGNAFRVHPMSHLQKLILILRFFVGGGRWFSYTHPCYLYWSPPCTCNLRTGPLQDSVCFPSLNYFYINVLSYTSWLVVHALCLWLVLPFYGERHFDVTTKNYSFCFLVMVT